MIPKNLRLYLGKLIQQTTPPSWWCSLWFVLKSLLFKICAFLYYTSVHSEMQTTAFNCIILYGDILSNFNWRVLQKMVDAVYKNRNLVRFNCSKVAFYTPVAPLYLACRTFAHANYSRHSIKQGVWAQPQIIILISSICICRAAASVGHGMTPKNRRRLHTRS